MKILRKFALGICGMIGRYSQSIRVILLYHSISERSHYLSTAPSDFSKHLLYLQDEGFEFVPLDAIVLWLEGIGDLPKRAVSITFDDGYEDNLYNALPILERFSAQAAIFISFEKRQIPKLTPVQIKELAAHPLITIGAHSITHRALTYLSEHQRRYEIGDCKRRLEELTQRAVKFFAYPEGVWDSSIVELVKLYGLVGSCTTEPATVKSKMDPYLLPRIFMYNASFLERIGLLSSGIDIYENAKRLIKLPRSFKIFSKCY